MHGHRVRNISNIFARKLLSVISKLLNQLNEHSLCIVSDDLEGKLVLSNFLTGSDKSFMTRHSCITCAGVGPDSWATGPWEEQRPLFLFPLTHEKLKLHSGLYLHQFQTSCWFYYENEVPRTKGISIPLDRRPQTSIAVPTCIYMCVLYQEEAAPPCLQLHKSFPLKILWISRSENKVHFLYSSAFVLINSHEYRSCLLSQLVCRFCLDYSFLTIWRMSLASGLLYTKNVLKIRAEIWADKDMHDHLKMLSSQCHSADISCHHQYHDWAISLLRCQWRYAELRGEKEMVCIFC